MLTLIMGHFADSKSGSGIALERDAVRDSSTSFAAAHCAQNDTEGGFDVTFSHSRCRPRHQVSESSLALPLFFGGEFDSSVDAI
jgi:hypothetical protein